ncbi:unnamed protein product [Cutaneotrichosporon oleaginosum]
MHTAHSGRHGALWMERERDRGTHGAVGRETAQAEAAGELLAAGHAGVDADAHVPRPDLPDGAWRSSLLGPARPAWLATKVDLVQDGQEAWTPRTLQDAERGTRA